MSTSTVIEPTAALIAALAETVSVTMSSGTRNLKGYVWDPASLDEVPACVVGPPDVRERDLEESESQLGAVDWFMDFPVSLYFDLDEAGKAQGQMVEALEAFKKAIIADPSLGVASILETKVTGSERSFWPDRARPLCGYYCTVSVFRIV